MASALGLSTIGAVALLGVALWAVLRRAFRGTRPAAPTGAGAMPTGAGAIPTGAGSIPTGAAGRAVQRAFRGEARAAVAALIVGSGVAGLLIAVGGGWSQGYGLPYALAGSVGAISGLATHTLLPRPSWPTAGDSPVVAELSPRGPTSFARQWVFVLPAAAACALVAGLLLAGLFSATDENGLHRVFQRRSLSGWSIEGGRVVDVQYGLSSSGPFPGWYYGVPVLIATVVLVAAVYWSLFRAARAARPASQDLFAADTALRALRTRFIMAASSAALAFQIAGLAAISGTVLRASHLDPVPTADPDAVPGTVPVEPGHTLALALVLLALVLAVVAVVLLVKAIALVGDLQAAARAPRERLDLARAR